MIATTQRKQDLFIYCTLFHLENVRQREIKRSIVVEQQNDRVFDQC